MLLNKKSATLLRPNQSDVLTEPPQTPFRSDEVPLADESSGAAGLIKWPRAPELHEFEQSGGLISAVGYFSMGDLTDASAAERVQLRKALPDGRPGRARLLRKMRDAAAPPAEVAPKKAPLYKGGEISAAIKTNKAFQSIGELLRPRREVVNIFSDALREGMEACPPYASSYPPKFGELHGLSKIQIANERRKRN